MAERVQVFVCTKETKRMWRYEPEGDNPTVKGVIYVDKSAFVGPPPRHMTVLAQVKIDETERGVDPNYKPANELKGW